MRIAPGNTLARDAMLGLAIALLGATGARAAGGEGRARVATAPAMAVYAGYYDTHHPGLPRSKPNPWLGAPQVDFVGEADSAGVGWDTSAIRIDNLSGRALPDVQVVVVIGSRFYDIWPADTLGAGRRLILAQIGLSTFDGSDTNPAGCPTCSPNDCSHVLSTIPEVRITIAGVTTSYFDNGQILNTGGVDAAGCPYTGTRNDESRDWQQIFSNSNSNAGVAAAVDSAAGARAWLAPNPARGVSVLRFRSRAPGGARLAVYDAAGRRVAAREEHALEPGDHAWPVAMGAMPPGVYRCVLAWSGGIASRNLVVVR